MSNTSSSTNYTANSTNWPVLQSKTEQKFNNGIFAVSAEYLRPAGTDYLPDYIESSLGNIKIWPNPSISSGTDGFERINATGYAAWDPSASQISIGYAGGTFQITARSKYYKKDPANPGSPKIPFEVSGEKTYTKTIYCIFETAVLKKIGETLPSVPTLRIFNYNNTDITLKEYSANYEFGLENFTYSRGSEIKSMIRGIAMSARINNFGSVKELEATYSIIPQTIDFGEFIGLI